MAMAMVTVIAALMLAPSGIFRGDAAARSLFIAASKSVPSRLVSSRSRSRSRLVASVHPSALSRHRSVTLIRGGDQRNHFGSSTFNDRSSSILFPESLSGRQEEATAAVLSVLAACRATRHVQPTCSKSIEVVSKQDASPVTVGDFASQALVLQTLHKNFPSDMFIAEEGSDALQKDDGLLNRVLKAVNHVNKDLFDRDQVLKAIDYGQGLDECTIAQSTRVWCLDPIDGTKGFLRGRMEGGQYCIALALIEDGEPVLSVLGCPNLPLPSTPATLTTPYGIWSDEEVRESETLCPSSMFSTTRGCLFLAGRGCGCYEIPLHVIEKMCTQHTAKKNSESITHLSWTQLRVTAAASKPLTQAKFCLGVERNFSDPEGTILKIASTVLGPEALTYNAGVQDIKHVVRMDGQGKYGLVSRGDAECFLRIPKKGYVDWVWDVAPGYLILKEAGGRMTDVSGRPIDFSQIGGAERRAKLPDHVKGVIGSCGGDFHEALVKAHAKVEQI